MTTVIRIKRWECRRAKHWLEMVTFTTKESRVNWLVFRVWAVPGSTSYDHPLFSWIQLKWSLSLKRDVSFYGEVNSVWTKETSQTITLGHFPINIVGFSGLKPISILTLELSGWLPDYGTCVTWYLDSLALNVFFRPSMLGAVKRLLPIKRARIDIS